MNGYTRITGANIGDIYAGFYAENAMYNRCISHLQRKQRANRW